ncbi:hypothetical protein SAMN05216505_114161 [Streptomyces prasinopilosus]|uniref:Uncharacterized protein n=1 Tax=Streptomyces prasinopilosus TaxID=67344 RepID=A0A1G6Z9I4_9ACTN|nr:hypothetical protein SAMN05216505_114161 [Streptomyces prasinopilosus]
MCLQVLPRGSGAFRLLNISTPTGVDSHPFPPPRHPPAPSGTIAREQAASSPRPARGLLAGRLRTATDDRRGRTVPYRPVCLPPLRTHTCRRAAHIRPTRPTRPREPARTERNRFHVSTSYRWRPSPRCRAESTAGCGTLVCGPLYDPWRRARTSTARGVRRRAPKGLRQAPTPVGPGGQGEPADRPRRGYDQ